MSPLGHLLYTWRHYILQISPTLKDLIPPLEPEEFTQLEKNCLENGILDPIKIWGQAIVDGHNRYAIAEKHNLTYKTTPIQFDSEDDVKVWIIDNQLGRRNLPPYERTKLEWLKSDIISDKAKANQGTRTDLCPKSDKSVEPIDTKKEVAKKAGIGHNTASQVKKIMTQATPELEEKVKKSQVSINTGAKIADEPAEVQNKIVDKIENEDKTATQALREVKREERREQLEHKEKTIPNDKYRIIYADPPWSYGNSGLDEYGHAERHYPTMTIDELCNLPIKEKTDENAVLFLWVTSPLLEDSFKVINSWGFKYKSSFIWDKVKHNFGYYSSVRHELLLIATKGSCTPDVKKLYDSVQTIERTEKHSEKPEEFRNIIDHIYNFGKKLELFARKETDGWETWGNE